MATDAAVMSTASRVASHKLEEESSALLQRLHIHDLREARRMESHRRIAASSPRIVDDLSLGRSSSSLAPLPALRPSLTPAFPVREAAERPSERADREASAAHRRAEAAQAAAQAAIADAAAAASHARSAVGVDPSGLDPIKAWALRRAPREAERAARHAEEARAEADALNVEARVAAISALAHSENVHVRALCGTDAVRTLTSLASFVKEERMERKSDAVLIGQTQHPTWKQPIDSVQVETRRRVIASVAAPLSPFRRRSLGVLPSNRALSPRGSPAAAAPRKGPVGWHRSLV